MMIVINGQLVVIEVGIHFLAFNNYLLSVSEQTQSYQLKKVIVKVNMVMVIVKARMIES